MSSDKEEKPPKITDERIIAAKRAILRGYANRLPGRPKLGEPAMSDPATQDTNVPPAQPKSNGTPVLPQWVVVVLTALAALAAIVPMIPGMPPVVSAIAASIAAICAALGIASPGIRKKE